jgi:hypothetical protein
MTTIALPEFGGIEQHFEDTVAALFAASGYVVQRRLRMRDPDELLELDTVATDYRQDPPRTVIVECKSGGNWGWNDLFRLLGRMRFLGISEGAVFAKRMPQGRTLERTNKRLKPHNTMCVLLAEDTDPVQQFVAAGFTTDVNETRLAVWRYSFAMERAIISWIEQQAKRDRKVGAGESAANALVRYYEHINSKIFFEPNLYRRLQRLFEEWQSSPKLSLGCAIEIGGGIFDANAPADPNNAVIKQALYEGKHELVQAAMFIEHRARFAVLKAVVDLIIAGPKPRPVLLIKGAPSLTEWHFLPSNVQAGIERLRERNSIRLYPALWQQYLLVFGGFRLADHWEREHQYLAAACGLDSAEVEDALGAFDLLFPLGDGWHRSTSHSHCRVLLMMPAPILGLGVYHRLSLHEKQTIIQFGYSDYTGRDLAKWYESAHSWLSAHGDLPLQS